MDVTIAVANKGFLIIIISVEHGQLKVFLVGIF